MAKILKMLNVSVEAYFFLSPFPGWKRTFPRKNDMSTRKESFFLLSRDSGGSFWGPTSCCLGGSGGVWVCVCVGMGACAWWVHAWINVCVCQCTAWMIVWVYVRCWVLYSLFRTHFNKCTSSYTPRNCRQTLLGYTHTSTPHPFKEPHIQYQLPVVCVCVCVSNTEAFTQNLRNDLTHTQLLFLPPVLLQFLYEFRPSRAENYNTSLWVRQDFASRQAFDLESFLMPKIILRLSHWIIEHNWQFR